MKTIYNTYVVMKSQVQCNRMKKLCVNNHLPIWEEIIGFKFYKNGGNYFTFSDNEFFVRSNINNQKKTYQVTEEEFIELLKTK